MSADNDDRDSDGGTDPGALRMHLALPDDWDDLTLEEQAERVGDLYSRVGLIETIRSEFNLRNLDGAGTDPKGLSKHEWLALYFELGGEVDGRLPAEWDSWPRKLRVDWYARRTKAIHILAMLLDEAGLEAESAVEETHSERLGKKELAAIYIQADGVI